MLVTCRDPSEIQIRTLAKSVFYRLGWPTGIQSTLAGLPTSRCNKSPMNKTETEMKTLKSVLHLISSIQNYNRNYDKGIFLKNAR